MGLKISQNLKHRLRIGVSCTTLLLVLISFSFLPFMPLLLTGCLATTVGLAVWEYYHIAKAKGHRPLVKFGVAYSCCYILLNYFSLYLPQAHAWMSMSLGVAFLLSFIYFFFQDRGPLSNLAISVFGIVYLTIPLSEMLNINYFFLHEGTQDGRWWLFYLLMVTKMTDTGAFVIGKLFGKTPLAKHISPKKTLEGAIGGMATALLMSFFVPWLAQTVDPGSMYISKGESLYLGLLIGLLGQIGDLGESLLKRDAGVKDSNQIPGVGGVLDLVDSLVFTTPVVYFFLLYQKGGWA